MPENDGKDATFNGYQVTTNNPGNLLLLFTVVSCLSCFFIAVLVFPGSPLHSLYRKIAAFVVPKGWTVGSDDTEDEEAGSYDNEETSSTLSGFTTSQDPSTLKSAPPVSATPDTIPAVSRPKKYQKLVAFLNPKRWKAGRDTEDEQAEAYHKAETSSALKSAHMSATPDHIQAVARPKSAKITVGLAKRNKSVDETTAVVVPDSGKRAGLRSKKRYTSNSLRDLCAVAVNRQAKREETQGTSSTGIKRSVQIEKSAVIHVNVNGNDNGNHDQARPTTTADDGRLVFDDLTAYFGTFNIGRPGTASSTTDNSTKASLATRFLDDQSMSSKSTTYYGQDPILSAEIMKIFQWAAP